LSDLKTEGSNLASDDSGKVNLLDHYFASVFASEDITEKTENKEISRS